MMANTNVRVSFEHNMCSQEFDIANTHDDNQTLFEREDVKDFYDELDNTTKLTEESIASLGFLPHSMSRTAIPLFREHKSGIDYQVHPCYSQLRRAHPSKHPPISPHFYVRRMKLGSGSESGSIPVIPFGRLFINIPVTDPEDADKTRRFSRWTGYEVLFGLDKTLWFVFDFKSLDSARSGWYPVRYDRWGKRIEERGGQPGSNILANSLDTPLPSASLHELIKCPKFDSAQVSLTERSLSSMTLEEFKKQIEDTIRQDGGPTIEDIDEKEVTILLRRL
ncbi:hypothetical protein F4777DRAFT_594321 [Nemania sp. FL0916]|nr:hypothetical protein F4777DRAFT_594321 [Nemania sp. FL0916]